MDICKHDKFCGGCIHQGIPYEEQLKAKEKDVFELLQKKEITPKVIDKIEGSPVQYRYRNKMEYTFGDQVKDGEMTLGMHQKGRFMSIVTVNECQLVHEDFNNLLEATLDFCKQYTKYHKKSHKGLMRNLIIRAGVHTKELLVNIVTSSTEPFDEEGFVKMLEGLNLEHTIVGILRTINDNIADAVNCDELKILKGRDYYMEKIMGLSFKVSAFSFFQTNVLAVEKLYSEALSLVDDYENMTVFDLFCGTGTIAQILASKTKKVVGVEIVKDAVLAARENAQLNDINNCEFIAGDVFEVLENISEKPDMIVLDPPRMGIQNKALDKIVSYDVDNIIYISCNPKTLVENLFYLSYYGYEVEYLKPFDNFPNTKHTECICLLTKKDKVN